jgi:hypothetical protein
LILQPIGSRPSGDSVSPRPDWVSIKEYAALYNVHPNTVAKWMDAGLLVWWRVSKTVRIKRQPPFDQRPAGVQPTS